jgi:hypothetical protein
MALAPLISQISPCFLKAQFFEFIQNRKGNLWIWENLFWELVPCVEVTFVSKFHPIWRPIVQESSLGRNGRILGEVRIYRNP